MSNKAIRYLGDSLTLGQLSGDGAFTQRAVGRLAEFIGHDRILLTPSGTAALELAAITSGVFPGSKARLPSFNFPSDANALALFGAELQFCEVDISTGSASPKTMDSIGEKPDIVSYVNYAGVGNHSPGIAEMAKGWGAISIEDNCHGLGGLAQGKPLGTFGDFGVLSFHSTKNFPIGEGGALIVNNSDYWERAQIIREKGTDRSKYLRGQVDKYRWQMLGSSYLMGELSAAFLLAQLEDWDYIQDSRKQIIASYYSGFETLTKGSAFESVPEHLIQDSGQHFYFLRAPDGRTRDALISKMSDAGIQITSHYEPLHNSPMGKNRLSNQQHLPLTDKFAETIIRFPVYPTLSTSSVDEVVRAFIRCVEKLDPIGDAD